MGEPFKNLINATVVRRLAETIAPHAPGFSVRAFVGDVTPELDSLELMQRVDRVARALHDHLPPEYPRALKAVLASLPAEPAPDGEGLGFTYLSLSRFVAAYGLGHFELSLDALQRLTRHFSCEFDIRPFIVSRPEQTLARMLEWARDPDPAVRRLASEGSRPRLPWGIRLQAQVRDPSPAFPILEQLKDDPDPVVRRSVANHLNDIARDHPALAVELASRWNQDASAGTREIVRHGLRTLIKKGNPEALRLLGFDHAVEVSVERLRVSPRRVELGEEIEFSFTVRSRADRSQSLSIDYAIHHVKKSGERSPKIFKLTKRTLAAREATSIERRHRMREVTVRSYYPGEHLVEILVNGQGLARAPFTLLSRTPAKRRRGASNRG